MDLKFKDNSKLKLDVFKQLEYIESTGTQYIDTGISSNIEGCTVELDFEFTSKTANNCVWGHWESNIQNLIRTGVSNAGILAMARGTSDIFSTSAELQTRYKITATFKNGANSFRVDSSTIGSNTNSYSSPSTHCYLFGIDINGSFNHNLVAYIKLYNYKLYNTNNILIQDFIPCITDLGTPGMYDTVSQTFFYNQGTGDFVAGPTVSFSIKPIIPKITTFYHQNCPHTDGYHILKYTIDYSKNNQDEFRYNLYKDSPLWNSISQAYPDLIPYTDACHAMLGDICTCIEPGPIQLASACNDIIQQGSIDACLENTGTTYIDTGIQAAVTDDFDIEYQFVNASGEQSVFGIHGTGTANMIMFGGLWWGGDSRYNYNQGTTRHILSKRGTIWTLDGVVLDYTTNSGNISNGTWCLFTARSGSNTATYAAKSKIYSFKLYKNNDKIIDLIPAYNGAVATMKDLVSNTFLTPLGSGNFTLYGAIVEEGYNITDFIPDCTYDETPIIPLTRVRADIGNVSGSLGELLQFSTLAGFNDAYEPQTKPRLVGTFTINDYYTSGQLTAAQAAFDGLTIVPDSNYLINFNDLAVQVLDPEQPNYNPAVGIILQSKNIGTTISNPIVSGGGRWFLSKTQAAAVTDISNWFYNKSTVTDTNGLVTTDTTQIYNFESFDEFEYFGCTSVGYNDYSGFCSCSKLKRVKLPNNITIYNAFERCGVLKTIVLPQIFHLGSGGQNFRESAIESIDLSNYADTFIPPLCFYGCSVLKNIILPQTIQTIGDSAFKFVGSGATFTNDDSFELNLPNLNTLSNRAFESCKTLTSIKSLGNVTIIPEECFGRTGRLVDCLLPNTVKAIGYRAFHTSDIKTINLPYGLEKILDYAFNETRNLKIASIPQSITKIGPGSFRYSCVNNISVSDKIDVELPNIGSTSNLYQLFENCKIIRNVTDLGLVHSIGAECFEGSGAILIVVPSTVTSVGNQRFLPSNCIIHLLPTTPPTIGVNNNYITPTTVKLYVGDGSSAAHDDAILQAYLADTNWATYSSRLDTWYNYLHPQS